MAKNPDTPKKPVKTPKSKAHRPDVQPIGPALAELLNPAINRGESGMGSGTGLQPPPDNSWDRRAGGEAAAHRARASTPKNFPQDGADPYPMPLRQNPQPVGGRKPPPNPPPQAGEGYAARTQPPERSDRSQSVQPDSPLPLAGSEASEARSRGQGGGTSNEHGFDEAPQANYGTSATIPTPRSRTRKAISTNSGGDMRRRPCRKPGARPSDRKAT